MIRLGRINELWDKKLTISMCIEDPDFRDIESDEVDSSGLLKI